MRRTREEKRREFLARMFKDAMVSYEVPYREWEDDEKEHLPMFMSLVGSGKLILDLAGGYGKAPPHLIEAGGRVVLGDLSIESMKSARETLAKSDIDFVRLDMNTRLPFSDRAFDGIWFAEAIEYVPPDSRERFLAELRRILRDEGVVFLNAEGLSSEVTRFTYLKNYLYWKIVKRAPVLWGEYIYMLHEPPYHGWHYHSLTLGRRIERQFRDAGFDIVKSKDRGEGCYTTYVLRTRRGDS
jgi:ubiquinone/menaquinone biosynthesis C-methylase UbiE